MSLPNDRRYLKTHEWHKPQGDLVTIGITQFAADELTDVTYVQLPAEGTQIKAGTPFGEIESVKATSDLIAGIDGTVAEVNPKLSDDPSLVNTDPFNTGWMIKVKPADAAQVQTLLDTAAYKNATGQA